MNSYPENINPAAYKLMQDWLSMNASATILELGCNLGTFGEACLKSHAEKDIAWHGVDYNKAALCVASERLTSAHHIDLDLVRLKDIEGLHIGKPDIVVMIDTLEHLRNPSRLMSMLIAAYPTAYVLIILPNIGCMSILEMIARGRFDYAQHGILDKTHLRHFTLGSAKDFLQQHGYKIASDIEWLVEPKYAHYLGNKKTVKNIDIGNMQVKVSDYQHLISLCSYGFGMLARPV